MALGEQHQKDPLFVVDMEPSSASGKCLTVSLILNAILASLGSFNFGYNLSVVNTTGKTFSTCPPNLSFWQCFPVSSISWGWVAGIMCAGALISSFVAGPIANRFGRCKCVLSANIPYFIGFILLVFGANLYMLLLGRFFVGLGVGISCIAVPLYLTEISSVAARGLIGSLHQMGIVTGIVAAELVALTGLYQQTVWRFMFGIAAIPCVIQLVGMIIFAPESPRYLVSQRSMDTAKVALRKLRGKYYSEVELDALINEASINKTSEDAWTLVDLLWRRISTSGKSMLVASCLHLAQQLSGINSIFLFSDSIFSSESKSSESSLVPLSIASLNFVFTVIAVLFIDKLGRRILALTSSSAMFLAGIALTVTLVFGWTRLAILAVFSFVGAFAVGMGPVPWIMTNELFPTIAVGSAVSFAVALNWLANMSVSVSFPSLFTLVGNYAFIPYSVIMLAFFIFSLFLLPETKGRPVAFI